jgi:hypothetical protein
MSAALVLRCDCGAADCRTTFSVPVSALWEARMYAETTGWTCSDEGDYAPTHRAVEVPA